MVTRDYDFIEVGARVKWLDPAIDDYEPEDREEQLNMAWVVYGCPDVISDDSDIVYIACGVFGESGYSEAEVLACELYPIDE